jgi:phage-related protein
MVDIIDEAAVEIVPETSRFGEKVRAAISRSLKGVNEKVKESLKPVDKTIQDSIVNPMEKAGFKVGVVAGVAGNRISAGISKGIDKAESTIDRFAGKTKAELEALGTEIDLPVKAFTGEAMAKIEALIKEEDGRNINLDVNANVKAAAARIRGEIEALQTKVAGAIAIDVNADTADAEAQISVLSNRLRLLDKHIKIHVDVDTDKTERSLATIGTDIDKVAKKASSGGGLIDRLFSNNGGDGSTGKSLDRVQGSLLKLAGIAVGAISAIAPIGPTLVGIAAAAVAVTGAIGLAAGAMISATAAAASLGLAFITVKIGISGVSDALKAQAKANEEVAKTGKVSKSTQQALDAAMKKLAPSARELVKAIAAIGPAWSKVQKATQQALFEKTGPLLKKLSDAYLPAVRSALTGVAGDFNKFGRAAIENITKASNVSAVTAVLESMRRTLRSLVPAVGNILAALGTFFKGATGQAESMSTTFLHITERFRAFATEATKSGKFQDFLAKASKAASALGNAIGGIAKVLGTIFAAGASRGVDLLDNIGNSLSAVNDRLKSVAGQKALAGFFGTIAVAAKAFSDIMSVLDPVLSGIGDLFDALAPALDNFRAALLPLAQTLGKQLGAALTFIAPAIASVVNALADLLTALQPINGILGPIILSVGAFFLALNTGLAGLLVNPVFLIAAAVVGLGIAFLKAYQNIKPFHDAVDQVGKSIKDVVQPSIENLKKAFSGFSIGDIGKKLKDAFQVGDLGKSFTDAFSKIGPSLSGVGKQLSSAFVAAGPIIADLGKKLGDLGVALAPVISQLVQIGVTIAGAVAPVVAAVVSLFLKLEGITLKMYATIAQNLIPIITELAHQFSKNILPAVQDVANQFNKNVVPVLLKLVRVIKAVAVPLSALAAVLVRVAATVLGKVTPPLLRLIGPVLGFLIKAIGRIIGFGFKLIGFFLDLALAPDNVVRALGRLNTWFQQLPGKIASALVKLGPSVGNAFKTMFAFVNTLIQAGISAAVAYFVTLPTKIVSGLINLGPVIGGAFAAAFTALSGIVQQGISNEIAFWVALPGRIIAGLGNLASAIGTVFTNVFNFVRGIVSKGISNVIAFYSALPGRVLGALGKFAGVVGGVFSRAFTLAVNTVRTGISNIISTVQTLPSKIAALGGRMLSAGKTLISNLFDGIRDAVKGVGGFASSIASSIKSALNSALHLPFTIKGPGPLPDFTIPAFARGVIVDRPTVGLFGEAGKEAVIPATRGRAQRAAQLLDQSGILDFAPVRDLIAKRLLANAPSRLPSQSDRTGSTTTYHSRTVNLTVQTLKQGSELTTDVVRALARVNLLVGP